MRCSGCLVVLASVASGLRVPTTSGQSSVARSFVSQAPAVESRRTVLGAVGCLSGLLVSRPAQALVVDEAAASTNPLCDACVSQVRSASGQEITIVGTAHISEDSAVLVRRVIRELQPDTVMIELDPSRAGRLMQRRSTQTADADASTVAAAPPPAGGGEASKPAFGMGQVVGRIFKGDLEEASTQAVGMGLASMYRQLDSMGFQSGGEFVAAVEEADRIGAAVLLGDRDARVTVRRLRDALAEVLAAPPANGLSTPPPALLAASGGGGGDFSRESVLSTMAVLKQRENVRALSSYMQSEVPPLYNALIAERDTYMANAIARSEGKRVVAVVGLAHVDGIVANVLRQQGRPGMRPSVCPVEA